VNQKRRELGQPPVPKIDPKADWVVTRSRTMRLPPKWATVFNALDSDSRSEIMLQALEEYVTVNEPRESST